MATERAPEGEPTLLELLEREARHRLTGDCADHVVATRLRKAAERLRASMEHHRAELSMAMEAGVATSIMRREGALAALTFVNGGGPLPNGDGK